MDFKIAREMIRVIRNESQNLANKLKDEDQDSAYDQWTFNDEPFINDMCLMVLVGVWHQLERELVFLTACANVSTITHQDYRQKVISLQQETSQKRWKNLIATLNLGSFADWNTSMEALRLLANCVKHEPIQEPDQKLLKHLKLPLKPNGRMIVGYAPLAESKSFREGLAVFINLPQDADFCTIAETFTNLADQFLKDVRTKTSLAQITGAVSLVEFVA